jgi:outer membrane protein TolC
VIAGEPAVTVRDGAIQLSLDQAIEVALRQNLGLIIQRYVREQRRLDILNALGIYDLRADATAAASRSDERSFDPFDPTSSENQRFDFGVTQLTPWGGDVSVGLDSSRNSATFPQTPAGRVPTSYSGRLSFGYTQPLLRNFGRLATDRPVLLAQISNQSSRQEIERQATLTIQQVVNAYWDLVGAQEQLVVSQESLSLARELHDRNRIQVDVGTMAPLELVQSEAAIATREEGIISSQAAVGDAGDELRRLLNVPPGELWELPIQATTRPETDERPAIDLEEAIRTAYEERPEIRQQQLVIEQSQLNSRFFRNQRLPRLDLVVGYNSAGNQPQFGDVYSELFGLEFTGWSTQLNFLYPIQNRSARAQSASADIELEISNTELEDLRDTIRTQVRQAARRVDTAAKQIEAARASVRFQERSLEAERKRYENGMSTSFEITQIQEDLTFARQREVDARITFQTALTEFYRVTGRLLEQEGVELVDREQPIRRFTLF